MTARRRCLCLLLLLLGWAAGALRGQGAVTYDITYVRAPRDANGGARWADVSRPMFVQMNSDLMLLHPSGAEEVLVDAPPLGAVADPFPSFDGQWIYYALCPNVRDLSPTNNTPLANFDIFKIHVTTRQVVQLTHGEYTPNTGIRTAALPYGLFNMGPTPVSTPDGPKIVFTSNRNGFIPPHGYTPVASQLFVMNEDGSDVQLIGALNVAGALHPFQRSDGNILFSSFETQGLRDNRTWGLWSIWPDGRVWGPVVSAFQYGQAFHFATERTDGATIVEDYYNANNMGFGTFLAIPKPTATSTAGFYPAFRVQNPPLAYTNVNGTAVTFQMQFTPTGMFTLTPFATAWDEAAALTQWIPDDPATPAINEQTENQLHGPRVGKVTMPSGAPNNDLLLVYASGPVNLLNRPTAVPLPDAGIYVSRGGGIVAHADALILLKNDPAYNEIWPRAVTPYKAIYGIDQPHVFAFLPNDGTKHAALPVGTPYGLIGTSSFWKRESFPGWAYPGINYDGLEAFNGSGEDINSNFGYQGADAGLYANTEITAVRILDMEPVTETGNRLWFNHVGERLRILGEIPLLKSHEDGSLVLDPEGNPDTSFWAKVPADTPITFQMLDGAGRVLTTAQTWHQVRPGEIRTDCGGCHAHSSVPLAFAATAAATLPPADLTLPARDVEYLRDIEPLIQRACLSCHQGNPTTAPGFLAFSADAALNYTKLANDRTAMYGIKPLNRPIWNLPNASRYTRIFASRRSLLAWKLAGRRTDGWTNASWPSIDSMPPNPYFPYLADLDYDPGPVDHTLLLTDAEKRLVYAWIDLALPINRGDYFKDENRPALTIHPDGNQVIVGAADAYSGVDIPSLVVTMNGAATLRTSLGDGRWTATIPTGTTVIAAQVKDNQGNLSTLSQQIRAQPPPPPLTITCPAPVSAASTTGQPVAVTYPAATAAGGQPPRMVTSAPPSGALFPVGATTVTATATDNAMQKATCTFVVTVTGPPPPPVLPPPAGLGVRGLITVPPTLTWGAVTGAIGYEVQVSSGAGTLVLSAIRVQTTQLGLPLGQPAGPYTWRVRACGTVVPNTSPIPTETQCANGAPTSAWAMGAFSR